MNEEKEYIRDKAYEIATGTFLTHSFKYKVFQETGSSQHVQEQFEDWSSNEEGLNTLIHELAYDIESLVCNLTSLN